ncbi:phage tail protein [Carnobacterium divergens]|uniref:major tail protein n=1 Tax=Carnobacterium divergens TaxID=2748 RepID=UPI001072739C|nr:major tail protein [Carnobacterium divergens]TFI67529.1 phage tail protein [Carnobacterium divergens]TFI67650.1 phage tail protein [Carnobacterium divergens]TFI82563.1 phage tail protein [Carnobacterium divergens]TFJ08630.1 phage tail protein [Carnobacterium divergens]TFJ13458.1 phage tail protein [Carnobacterium divergens]
MTLVGFKRATIGVFGKDGKCTKKYVVEGVQDKGATKEAEITGLNKEPKKIYGSDITYHVAQKGTGDVEVNLGILDLPENASDEILGYAIAQSGITYIGEQTEAPFCSIMLESSTMQGETAKFSILKGKFSKESIKMNTLEGDDSEPEADSYKFAAVSADQEGEAKGQVVAKYFGKEETALKKMDEITFPGLSTTPPVENPPAENNDKAGKKTN